MTAGHTRGKDVIPRSFYGCEPLERRLLMAAGDLDPSFSGDGRVTTSFPSYSSARGMDVALQPDGKIVVAGFASTSNDADFAVARYLSDGTPDPSFSGGRVTVSPTRLFFGQNERYESATAVALRPDGRIVVGGNVLTPTGSFFTVVQLTPDGSPDASFGLNGATYDDSAVYDLEDLKIDAQGRIVFAGLKDRTMLVGRLTPDGRYDPTFNGSGIAAISFPGAAQSFGNALALGPDGQIVVGGYATVPGGYDFALARLLPDGTLDDGFGFIGRVLTAVGQRLSGQPGFDLLESIALAPDGRIWAAGYQDFTGVPIHARYLSDGSLDPTFGRNGLGVDTFGTRNVIRDIVLQPDGKAVEVANHSVDDVFRFRAEDGRLDPSFAGGGMAEIGFPDVSGPLAYAAALQPDGGIVVAGAAVLNNVSAFAVFRLQGDPPVIEATDVWALSSAWSGGFRQRLAAEGKGSTDFGYTLAADDPSGPPLPWTNLDTLAVRLSRPLTATALAGSLSVTADGRNLAVQSVAASPSDDKVMLIRLAAPLTAGRVRLRIGNVQDAAGRPFERTIPLLPGDVDQSGGAVNASDLVRVRNGVGRTGANPGTWSTLPTSSWCATAWGRRSRRRR